MKNRWMALGIAMAFVALVGAAMAGQGNGSGSGQQGGGQGNGSGSGTGIDPATRTTWAGEVVRFEAAPGAGMPQLVVTGPAGEKVFPLGPYWFLAKSGFAAAPADRVEVDAFACTSCTAGVATAEVRNRTKALTLTLRDPAGLPLWTGGGSGNGGCSGGQGNGNGNGNGGGRGCGGCDGAGPDMTKVENVEGAVVSFAGGPGGGQPTLVLATASGDRAFVVSPYRILRSAGISFATGDRWALRTAPSADATHQVVLSMKNLATGFELQLRDPATGKPLGGSGRGCSR